MRHQDSQCALLKYGKRVRARMAQADDPAAHAAMLADVCVELDVRFDNSPLTLEWTLDYYIGLELERRAYPRLLEIWAKLSSAKHHYGNPLEYFGGTAYCIPHATKRICVYGAPHTGKLRYLVVDDSLGGDLVPWHRFYVRNVWPRTKLNCIGGIEEPSLLLYRKSGFDLRDIGRGLYGDCRDPGHVLTYERIGEGHGKADHVIWDVNAPLRWLFETGRLWSEMFAI